MLGEINVLLTAVAMGLAVLDFTCFLALRVSAQIGRSQFGVKPAEQVMPSVSQPVAAPAINQFPACSLADSRN
jgi:hypothetical protein